MITAANITESQIRYFLHRDDDKLKGLAQAALANPRERGSLGQRARKEARAQLAKILNEEDRVAWIPVKRGAIYCSPACGGKCTLAAHDLATKRADELCARLGPGWRPRVWENLGWHYSAISSCSRWKIHVDHRNLGTQDAPRYTAFLGEPGNSGGIWVGDSAKAPEQAMRNTWAKAKSNIDWYVSFLTADAYIPTKRTR